ncbi:hypothetical protein SLL34_002806 [Acinetobacter baumannii]|nr:hypothetical protein [Acinetobacter baumannii]
MKQTISNRQGKQLAVYTDGLKDAPVLMFSNSFLRDEIAQIQIPALLIAGTEDPVTTVADAEFMQKAINNSQLAKLEASHLSNIEQPQRFTQELTRFIQQI